MEINFQHLSLNREEEEEICLESSTEKGDSGDSTLSLVGSFTTPKNIKISVLRQRLEEIWCPGKGFDVKDLGHNRFMFQFFHPLDLCKVLHGGPWVFHGQLLLLRRLQHGDIPTSILLHHVQVWVQIHDIPLGEKLGNFLGNYMEYDPKNNDGGIKLYMRIRVEIDVRQPLKRFKKICAATNVWSMVAFKYEFPQSTQLCFLCGILGHIESICPSRFDQPLHETELNWGRWLFADHRQSKSDVDKLMKDWEKSHKGEHSEADQRRLMESGSTSAEKSPTYIPKDGAINKGKSLIILGNNEERVTGGVDSAALNKELKFSEDRKRKRHLSSSLPPAKSSNSESGLLPHAESFHKSENISDGLRSESRREQ